jgi:hypothetical protein
MFIESYFFDPRRAADNGRSGALRAPECGAELAPYR